MSRHNITMAISKAESIQEKLHKALERWEDCDLEGMNHVIELAERQMATLSFHMRQAKNFDDLVPVYKLNQQDVA